MLTRKLVWSFLLIALLLTVTTVTGWARAGPFIWRSRRCACQ
jgi:hypothetical protein